MVTPMTLSLKSPKSPDSQRGHIWLQAPAIFNKAQSTFLCKISEVSLKCVNYVTYLKNYTTQIFKGLTKFRIKKTE